MVDSKNIESSSMLKQRLAIKRKKKRREKNSLNIFRLQQNSIFSRRCSRLFRILNRKEKNSNIHGVLVYLLGYSLKIKNL